MNKIKHVLDKNLITFIDKEKKRISKEIDAIEPPKNDGELTEYPYADEGEYEHGE